jgi:DNA-binding LacI/PurR family transcriptional regulator
MVVVGRDPNGDFDNPCVDNDQAIAMRLALDHLWDIGASRPAFVTFPLRSVQHHPQHDSQECGDRKRQEGEIVESGTTPR